MGRPPLKKKQRQLAVALPPDLRSQLEAAALAADHSLAEEIRARLVSSFDREAVDKPTQELAADVVALAEQISRQKGFGWHWNENAHETLVAAVNALLADLKPKRSAGPPVALPSDLMWGDDDPATLGRSIARHYQQYKTALAKNTAELLSNLRKGEKS
jgi:hypothetical protein